MNKNRLVCGIVALLAGILVAIQSRSEDHAGDIKMFQGVWTVVAAEKGGHEAGPADLKEAEMAFSEGKFTWKMGQSTTEGEFSLDAAKTPKEIRLTIQDKTLAGIYQLEGGAMKICVGEADDRPTTEFTTKAGQRRLLLVLERRKS
jgi:uncharacterized protein (TIGR03067 family)